MKICPKCSCKVEQSCRICNNCGFKLLVEFNISTSDKTTSEHQASITDKVACKKEDETPTSLQNYVDTCDNSRNEESKGSFKKRDITSSNFQTSSSHGAALSTPSSTASPHQTMPDKQDVGCTGSESKDKNKGEQMGSTLQTSSSLDPASSTDCTSLASSTKSPHPTLPEDTMGTSGKGSEGKEWKEEEKKKIVKEPDRTSKSSSSNKHTTDLCLTSGSGRLDATGEGPAITPHLPANPPTHDAASSTDCTSLASSTKSPHLTLTDQTMDTSDSVKGSGGKEKKNLNGGTELSGSGVHNNQQTEEKLSKEMAVGYEVKDKHSEAPTQCSQGTQQFPGSDTIPVHFYAVVSKELELDPNNDRIFLRSEDLFKTWDEDGIEMFPIQNLNENGFTVEGQVDIQKKMLFQRISYKYFIYKYSGKKCMSVYEYIYEEKENEFVNRSLCIKQDLLTVEGAWHQYDGVIHIKQKKGWLPFSWKSSKEDKLVNERNAAGETMLGSIFGCLKKWSKVNVNNFFIQLQQFFYTYSNSQLNYNGKAIQWKINYGSTEVQDLFSNYILKHISPQSNKKRERYGDFHDDPLRRGIVFLLVWNMYLKQTEPIYQKKYICHLCQLLSLPNIKREDFHIYWTDLTGAIQDVAGLAHAIERMYKSAKENSVCERILVIPLLHLLKGASQPFELNQSLNSSDSLIELEGTQSYIYQDNVSRYLMELMGNGKHLLKVDHLLACSWMSFLSLDDLMTFIPLIPNIPVNLLGILCELNLKSGSISKYMALRNVAQHIIKNLHTENPSNKAQDIEWCLKSAIGLLREICRHFTEPDLYETPLEYLNLVCQIAEMPYICNSQIIENIKEPLDETLEIMIEWQRKTFSNNLINSSNGAHFKVEKEILVWNQLITLSLCNDEVTSKWQTYFKKEFEGKLRQEKPMHQIEIYCNKIEDVAKTPSLCNSLEKCALEAAFCQETSVKDVCQLVKKYDFSKFGNLISVIVLKSWPTSANGDYIESEELVMKHLFNSPIAKIIFHTKGAYRQLIDVLDPEAKDRMALAGSALQSVLDRFITGRIQIKTLNQVLEKKQEFIELLKTDGLCDDERCKDTDAMKQLLSWRTVEHDAVRNEMKLVERLLINCNTLLEYFTVNVKELESKFSKNIELMNLDDFMEVQRFDKRLDGTGKVTYFNLNDQTRQMASDLYSIGDSLIFSICWEKQAKKLSKSTFEADESLPDRVKEEYTLDFIYSNMYKNCYDEYKRIYEDLKSGNLSFEDVDIFFEDYKDKYDAMRKDLKIMCRINSSDNGTWIKKRVIQINEYHGLHLTLESARVLMEVRKIICPDGNFQELQALIEVNSSEFEKKCLNLIDFNWEKTQETLKNITEPRRKCLEELVQNRNLEAVKWVKKALKDINELKVFVDLASIFAGENDLDVDRVACFHDAVLGYSSILYGLKPDANFHAFNEALTKLWKALENDNNIPTKLRDTARHLEWWKTVKDNHGSVELSSISLALAINSRGKYIIDAQNKNKLSLETALRLQLPEEHESNQSHLYSLEDLRDLQNKLMLMSGKGEHSKHDVDYFTEVFDSVQRLAATFVDLYAAGNLLFRCWEAQINCNSKSDTSIMMQFHLNSIEDIEVKNFNEEIESKLVNQLTTLCRKMETYLDDWRCFMGKQRSELYYLNFYTAEQIVYLCRVLTEKNMKKELDKNALMMLSFIKPNCTVTDVWESWGFLNDIINGNEHDSSSAGENQTALDGKAVEQGDCLIKLDFVWKSYMERTRTSCQDSLDLQSLGTLLAILSKKVNLEGGEEDGFMDAKNTTIRRKLPKGLLPDQPNLIICPKEEILTSCICLYMTSDYAPLPTYDEVLLCEPDTSYEQVELFLRRCLTADDPGENLTQGYRGKIHTMLFADQLSYEVSCSVEKLFHRMTPRSTYALVIYCSSDREHAYIPTTFSQFKKNLVPYMPLKEIQKYLTRHHSVPQGQNSAASVFNVGLYVGIVSSKRAGVGKSLYIQRLYEELEGKAELGSTHKKCIRLTEPKINEHTILQSLNDTPGDTDLKLFHFDVTSSVQKGFQEFLFKLFFLHYLMDSDGIMWQCSSKHLYLVETLESTCEQSRYASRYDSKENETLDLFENSRENETLELFEVFPMVHCRPPKAVLGMEMREDTHALKTDGPLMDDKCFRSEAFQRPYQYLNRFHNKENLDKFTYHGVEGTHAEFLQILLIYCGIIDPSWAELRNFVWFLNQQLQDCETSVFCKFELTGDTLKGFKTFVVEFMILMSKDFATPSLSLVDQSPGKQQICLEQLSEKDIAPFLIRKRWESEPHPYIFFNDDHESMTFIGFHLQVNGQNGVDAISPSTHKVIKRNIMTRQLFNALRQQKVPFNDDFDKIPRGERIERLCNVLGVKRPSDPDETYELTTDNVLKMMAIHMRFRCGIPVIIMGETGCGKTRLIKYLCDLKRRGAPSENMKLVKVHGGTTSDMIYNQVRKAVDKAVKHEIDSVLFLDEANTTEAISSIKEILCDNTVQGQPIGAQTGLQIIAACNPYRKHTDKMIDRLEEAGLGYRVRAKETMERLGSIPLRQLVYRVHVLPPSMIPLVWDFGQLSETTEKMYIHQIVNRVMATSSINSGDVKMIVDVLSSSQSFMRNRKDECSFVSLRDVERSMQVFVWFYKNYSMFVKELEAFFEKQPTMQRKVCSDNVVWSLLMAVGVCYQACLETKEAYQHEISKLLPSDYNPKRISYEISLMQDLLLSGVPMGNTIAKNNALKENVFLMVICIELRIPLFLVGKPGSSKSLSKTLVADAMQGTAAHSELFKRLKQIHLVSFQCSPHSTPEGIINTFKQCARFQESKNLDEYSSVVVLDEIGLAEDSPKMPLKTLHPLLEEGCIDDEPQPHKRVGFIGISNWALDPAKMNRGIFVSRGDPNQKELIKSAMGICSADKMTLEKIKPLFTPFANAYMKISKKAAGFFGLRDYYSLVKMVCAFVKDSKDSPTVNQISEAVQRNFSGKENVYVESIFTEELKMSFTLTQINVIDLIRQNINHVCLTEESRYLLILTKNYAALHILQQFLLDRRHPEIIFGSSFPKDQEYTQICRNINRVKMCMETGQTVVLLNLQNLYESLYDALNQYYVSLGGQKYVDLGLGTHRVKCRVHKDFRLIVIEEKEVVHKEFPIPLINRLEKHYLDINTVLKNDQRNIVKKLEDWVKAFVFQHSTTYSPSYVFIGYHSETCSSVILQVTEKMEDHAETKAEDKAKLILDKAKLILLDCATPDSVIRLENSRLCKEEIEKLAEEYFKVQVQTHSSLADFIASYKQVEESPVFYFTEVTTFSRLLTAAGIDELKNITGVSNINLLSLQQFDTENAFLKEIRHFLDSTHDDDDGVLIIQTDFDEDCCNMSMLASAKYSCLNEINKRMAHGKKKRFVYFVTKLPRIEGGTSYVGIQGGPWKSVHIDDIRRSSEFVSNVHSLKNHPMSQLFKDTDFEGKPFAVAAKLKRTDLLPSCVQRAVSMLRDRQDSGVRSTRRVDILLTLLECTDDKDTFVETLQRRLHALLKKCDIHNWVLSEALNINALQEGGTFTRSLWKRLQAVVTPLLAHLFSVIDRDCNLDLLEHGKDIKNLWLAIFAGNEIMDVPNVMVETRSNIIMMENHVTFEGTMRCRMPFSWWIKDFLDGLLVQAQQREQNPHQLLEGLYQESQLGQNMAAVDKEKQREFFQRYLQDFISMTVNLKSERDLRILCEALTSCVTELQRKLRSEQMPSLPLIHLAHDMYNARLLNLSRMISLQPDVAPFLLHNSKSECPEMILDVNAAIACVELLEWPVLDSGAQWQGWLKQVKQIQASMELVCSQSSLKNYGKRCRGMFNTICNSWNRISILSLFVEHVVLHIEFEECKLRTLVLNKTQTMGKALEENADVKSDKTFAAMIEILKLCKQEASDLICNANLFRFGLQCSVCLGEIQDPVDLPCHHVFCLTCTKRCLIVGQMYCLKCKDEVPEDFQLKVSEELRTCISRNSQFRQRCSSFFIDLVSTMCFKDNIPPSRDVVLRLLSFLSAETGENQIHTKHLSPFNESMDKNPVVRSVILKLLLTYSFEEVKEYLQQHLLSIEESHILAEKDKTELYVLYINCLEDKENHERAKQQVDMKEEATFLHNFLHAIPQCPGSVSIENLQKITRVRLSLDMAADLLITMSDTRTNPQDGGEDFLSAIRDLCEQSRNDWYRVYLIRKISNQQGVEFVKVMLKEEECRWLFPAEIQQQNQDGSQMDPFLLYGEDYKAVRQAVAEALLKGTAQDIEDTLEGYASHPPKLTLYILLALVREVTSLYRSVNPNLHPTPEQLQTLQDFIKGTQYLKSETLRDFATSLVDNRLGALSIRADHSIKEHIFKEMTIHLAAVLHTGTGNMLAPLKHLMFTPSDMRTAFIPTMPDDMLAVAQRLIAQDPGVNQNPVTWYTCPNGHYCVVDMCGLPMVKANCLDCGVEIGGQHHRAVSGFTRTQQQGDRTRPGHILGDPQRRDNPDTLDTKGMSLIPFTLVRMLTHLAMLRGSSERPEHVQQIIQPAVAEPSEFLIGHLQKDLDQLSRALGKGVDDTVNTVHLMVRSLFETQSTNQYKTDNDVLSTKDARNEWETMIASEIITPHLKDVDQRLNMVNVAVRDDSRVSSNLIMRLTSWDECPFLSSLPRGSPVHSSVVWSCRKRLSLLTFKNIVEQNNGKETLPLLWRFLQKETEFRMVKFLPEILALQRNLVKKFQNSTEQIFGSIEQFVQKQTESMKVLYKRRVQIFLNTWNRLRVSVANNEMKIPQELCSEDLHLGSDLKYFLPQRRGPGLCAMALVSHLVALQNELVCAMDRLTGEETRFKMRPTDLMDFHVIRYELEKDLLPLIMSNCQYSLESGHETLSEYDLPKIQQRILARFLQGKPLITIDGIPTLIKRHDRQETIFRTVKGKVSQVPLASLKRRALSRELDSYSVLCDALKAVELALDFLSMTGGDAKMPLEEYLRVKLKLKQIDSQILNALKRCNLSHCVALWQVLASLKSENMLCRQKRDPFSELGAEYQELLDDQEKRELQRFSLNNNVDIWLLEVHEFIVLILGKPRSSDTYRPDWSMKDTMITYMEDKDVKVPAALGNSIPEEILLSKIVEAWKFTVKTKQEMI